MMHMGGGFVAHGMNRFPTQVAPTATEAETLDAVNKAWFEVQWQGNSLDMIILNIQGEGFQKVHFWLLADTQEIARGFVDAVSRWENEIRGEVLVFDNGHWYKDEYLFQDIKNATFANLKELFLSSKMRWIANPQQGTMEEVMAEQVGKLREQMVSVNMTPIPEMPEEFEGMPPLFGPMMARSRRMHRRMQG